MHLLKFYEDKLKKVLNHTPEDGIHRCTDQCKDIDVAKLDTKSKEYFKIAKEKLNVFPFKNVQTCWFRLYTDCSIVNAIELIEVFARQDCDGTYKTRIGHEVELETEDAVKPSLVEVVAILDNALIVAGGLGREDVIHEILNRVYRDFMYGSRKRKRKRRLTEDDDNNDINNDEEEARKIIPENEFSIPKINHPLSKIESPSMTTFQKHMYEQKRPTVLTDILNHWPAMRKWKSIDYWLECTMDGCRLVPVEIGRSYVDEDWGQKIMPFKDFLDKFILSTNEQTGYLAQHDLLGQIRRLRADITIPDYCYLDAPLPDPHTPVALAKSAAKSSQTNSNYKKFYSTVEMEDLDDKHDETDGDSGGGEVHVNTWFGPAWTISPLHHDPYHNILCQIVGKKYIRLYDPRHSDKLFPRSKAEPAPHDGEGATIDMSNTSSIDVAAMELSRDEDWDDQYPGLSDVPYQELILEAGQALYIPVGWWHYVRSISAGISLSFWWN